MKITVNRSVFHTVFNAIEGEKRPLSGTSLKKLKEPTFLSHLKQQEGCDR